ncbi:MAG TPA: magnesium transporter [Gemmatimonadales bacterium]
MIDEPRELVALIREGRWPAVIERAASFADADLADVVVSLRAHERVLLLTRLPAAIAARAIVELPRNSGIGELLAGLGDESAARIITTLEDAAAADLLGQIETRQRERILDALQHPSDLGLLLRYDATSAGGLMTARVVSVVDSDQVGLAAESVRRQAASIGDLTEIFVVDAERRLRGVLPVKALLLAEPGAAVRDVMDRGAVHLTPDVDQHQVARILARYNLASVPVVDRTGRLVGRITAADVRDVAADQAAADLLRIGGVPAREAGETSWLVAVRGRLTWLYLNLLPAFAAAAVVYFFQGSLLRAITLVVWMPVVASAGGSAGTQALAVAVRRFTTGSARSRSLRALLVREATIGAVNGVAIGGVVAGVAVLLGESWKLGVVVLAAMTGNVLIATVAGAMVPRVLHRFGREPWPASPVMVTALADACGFALLLGLASAVLL